MGTRGAWGLRYQDTDKVTYNHYDSYPSGLGLDVIKTVRAFNDEQLAGAAARLTMVDESIPVTPDLVNRYAAFCDTNVSSRSATEWYCLLRHAQGEMTPYIDGRIDHMIDSQSFLADSLFCEWAYIMNMDTRELEVYAGFNKDAKAPGRYAHLTDRDYNGVKLIASIPLDDVRSWSNDETAKHLAAWEQDS